MRDSPHPNLLLDHIKEEAKTNTPRACIKYCLGEGFSYAGVQAGKWCLCGNTAPPMDTLKPDQECTTQPCSGDSKQICGANMRMNVYVTGRLDTTTSLIL